jgi:hypothetical protein
MKVCHQRVIPVTPYSGGTSLEGHFEEKSILGDLLVQLLPSNSGLDNNIQVMLVEL